MIMISYARSDLAAVLRLVEDLKQAREDVWIDRELGGGQAWWRTILEMVRKCDVFIVALSPSYLDSRACKVELDYAARLGRGILPVLVKDVQLQLAPAVVADTQVVDYRSRSIETAIALVSAIKDLGPAPPLPTPLPDPPEPPISYLGSFSDRVDAHTLTFTEQIHLVAELESVLDHSADRAIAAQLLRRLRLRPDITESVGRDIDELLRGTEFEVPRSRRPKSRPKARGGATQTDADGEGSDPHQAADSTDSGSRKGHRRYLRLALAVGLAVALVATIVGIWVNRSHRVAQAEVLPASAPLSKTELVVPMDVGDNNWALFVADTSSTSSWQRLPTTRHFVASPVLSPDRKTLLYLSADDASIKTLRSLRVAGAADLSGDRELFSSQQGCNLVRRPAWNPAVPDMIALVCENGDKSFLRLMYLDGRIDRDIDAPDGMSQMGGIAFSSDGKRLGFWAAPVALRPGGGILYTVDVDAGSPPKRLLPSNDAVGSCFDMAFSPNGKYVAFGCRASAKSDDHAIVFRASINGSNITKLAADQKFDCTDPTWSPDSSQLAYTSSAPIHGGPGGVARVWTMKSNGDDPHVLWEGAGGEQGAAAWTAR